MNEYRLAKNIRALRISNGESLKQLASVINVTKNAVLNYEKGIREPNMDIIKSISDYYMVSVDELLFGDVYREYTIIDECYDKTKICNFFPIVGIEEGKSDRDFERAYELNQNLYKKINNISLEELDDLESLEIDDLCDCIDGYVSAYNSNMAKNEAAANLLSIYFLVLSLFSYAYYIMKNPNVIYNKLKEKVECKEFEIYRDEWKDILDELNSLDYKREIKRYLNLLSKDGKFKDLSYYYIAIKYAMEIANENENICIGAKAEYEMMSLYASIGNKYAKRYIDLINDYEVTKCVQCEC